MLTNMNAINGGVGHLILDADTHLHSAQYKIKELEAKLSQLKVEVVLAMHA